ncbi:MAG TPA: nucleotide exchange factor GrpE [Candidatus Eisenbacteria bacterium]|nr:nucleotide exchange factor GrpE [Candidatus Eisenbacteria bacterium]
MKNDEEKDKEEVDKSQPSHPGEATTSIGSQEFEEDSIASLQNDEEESRDNVLLQKLEESEAKYRRALADYQNLVRRTHEEKQEWAKFSSKELVLKLLPILDTLMLAEKHTQDKNFVLVVQQFLQTLKDEGVARIKTVGEEFNPQTMEAVTTTEGDEGKVVEEIRAGYALGETVLRPAQVIVGK